MRNKLRTNPGLLPSNFSLFIITIALVIVFQSFVFIATQGSHIQLRFLSV